MLDRDFALLQKLYSFKKKNSNPHFRRFVLSEVNSDWYDISVLFNEETTRGTGPNGTLWLTCRYMLSYQDDQEHVRYESKTKTQRILYAESINHHTYRHKYEAAHIKLTLNAVAVTNEQQIREFFDAMQKKRESLSREIPAYFVGENIRNLFIL
ncbi:MAG: hypothetical protein HY832_02725 [Candidatus Aenigmarchaeota archaeon]|nr:hypothetical protein [Candidatus Aenigmarchaeota archaeon]